MKPIRSGQLKTCLPYLNRCGPPQEPPPEPCWSSPPPPGCSMTRLREVARWREQGVARWRGGWCWEQGSIFWSKMDIYSPPPPLGNLHFSPQYTVCESRKIIAWPKGEKIKTLGEKISYIFPQLDFCALFSMTIKIIGEKIWYYVPYGLHFFPSFP